MTPQQKEAIGYMILAVRACHLTSDQEENIETAMMKAFEHWTPQDAVNIFKSITDPISDHFEQLEFNAELEGAITENEFQIGGRYYKPLQKGA